MEIILNLLKLVFFLRDVWMMTQLLRQFVWRSSISETSAVPPPPKKPEKGAKPEND